jgi:uncharacterized protein YgbK (DUF1537 family)
VLIVVGSYVPKTTEQLTHLLGHTDAMGVELDAKSLLDLEAQAGLLDRAASQADRGLRAGRTVVLYTSREIVHTEGEASLNIGRAISQSLIRLLGRIPTRPRMLIAKGGITSSDVATEACGIRRAKIMGQILPGVPVWQCGSECRYPDMPLVVFPGNVGAEDALTIATMKIES